MAADPRDFRFWLFESAAFVCLFEAGDLYKDHKFMSGTPWLVFALGFSIVGFKWPAVREALKTRYFNRALRSAGTAASAHAAPKIDDRPPTLLDLFLKTDFSNTLRATDTDSDAYLIKSSDGYTTRVRRQVYSDFDANTKFIGFYVFSPTPASADISGQRTVTACLELLKHDAVQETFDHVSKSVAVLAGYGDQMTSERDLRFSGRVFIYHEEFLSIPQRADIIKAYEAKGMAVTFRGGDYHGTQVIAWHREHDTKKEHQ